VPGSKGFVLSGLRHAGLDDSQVVVCEVSHSLSEEAGLIKYVKLDHFSVDDYLILTSASSVIWLHSWEEHNLLDVVSVSQKHCNSVDSHSPSGGGG